MTFTTVDFQPTRVSAQSETKRWVVIFHQPSSIPVGALDTVAAAGGTVVAELSEIGALVATSNNPEFAAEIAKNKKVAEVTEEVEMQFIPSPEQNKRPRTEPTPI